MEIPSLVQPGRVSNVAIAPGAGGPTTFQVKFISSQALFPAASVAVKRNTYSPLPLALQISIFCSSELIVNPGPEIVLT